LIGDEEALPIAPQSLDLILSPLSLQWVNDLPGSLLQIRNSLKPDGLFLATLLGNESLKELRTAFLKAETDISQGASPHVAPFPELKDMGSLLQRAGFALPVADQDMVTVRYDTMFALMADLRKMGAANALQDRAKKPLRRDILMRAAEIYQSDFSDEDGRIRASFQILSISGWAPHESQQKPLQPGSAKTHFSNVLVDKSK
ncbi:MAG: methyltransferase domain-containing protein, partial [Cohaesibacter sp.]|nr:methyltransferase domain-containing protein [Cohaesibacter sp.]